MSTTAVFSVSWTRHDGDCSIGLMAIWKGWIGQEWLLTVWEKVSHSSFAVSGDRNRYFGAAEADADAAKAAAVRRAVELGCF